MPIKEFIDFAISVSASLVKTHKEEQIHGAICPENINWDQKNLKAELVDLSNRDKKPLLNKACLPYISPEQTGRINLQVDYRTDLYSLGIVFFEILVGKPPFFSNDTMEMIHLHIAGIPPEPHAKRVEVPEQISNIILRLLQKNPDGRYQSAYGLQHDLELCARQWKQNGSIKPFELGKSDLKGIFRIPQKLYGRENELKTLLDSFERITTNSKELIIVTGYSGVGKSVLVKEVQKPIAAKRGYFIEGKFDQYQRNIPYFAWQQAFNALVNYLLMESDERLADWKARILEAVGPNGKVLTDIIRNLVLIIGHQPDVPALDGAEGQNRFNSVFQNFIKVVADKEHPLVIFLDDFHWIDSASLKLLQVLVTDPDLSHVQYIGVYRDNEVDEAHPLIVFLKSLKDDQVAMTQITLQNLEINDVNALIADTLQSSPDDTHPIAELIYSKTAGNAFFTHQILHTLNDENLLTFDSAAGYWNWDIETIRALEISENVVELISRRMRKLPIATQDVLKLASCIGNQFDIETLCFITQKKHNEIDAILKMVLQEEVILPLNGKYKFAHDRIQQAAYSLIAEEVKNKTHLEIGRILLEEIPEEEREERIFDIVKQLNIGAVLFTRSSERTQLAELNLIAGNRAKLSTAYESALEYFGLGIELLGENAWDNNYDLSLDLFTEAAEAASLSGDYDIMKEWGEAVLNNARTIGEKMKVIDIKIAHETTQMNHENAINIGLKYLRELGLDLNTEVSKEEVSLALAETIELLGMQTADKLISLPELMDPKLEYQVHIINSLLTPNYFSNQNLLILSVCVSIDILIHNGNTSESALAYAYCSMILSNLAIRQFKTGYLAGQVAISMADKFTNDQLECPVKVLTYGYIFQYLKPLYKNIENLFHCFQIGVDHGNLEYASYSIAKGTMSLFCSGKNLENVIDVTQNYTPFLKKHALFNCFFTNCMIISLSNYLRDSSISSYCPEKYWSLKQEAAKGMGESQDDIHLFYDYQALQTISIHFGRYAEAFEIGNKAHKCESSLHACYPTPPFYFYDTLACLRMTETTDEKQKELLAQRIKRNMKLLTEWAGLAPFNFEHMLQLARAEQARIQNPETAPSLYEKAIKAASMNGFNQDLALCYDLAAKYYKQNGFEEFFKIYKFKAHEAYKEWGALALVKHLEKQDPSLFTSEPSPISDTPGQLQLDLNTVIKASHVIAGEMVLDKLLAKMMHIVIENAGAQNGFLILARGGEWIIEAIADVDQSKVQVLQAIRIEENETVSAGIINYVARTHETIVLVDAANEGNFTGDDTIQHRQSKSVLCIPLINQDQISGILYLENNLMTGTFTKERVDLLILLSSEMALALDNARVYLELERSEEKFREVFESMTDVFTRSDNDGKCLMISPSIYQVLGYKSKEILGKSFTDFYADPEQRIEIVNQLQKTKKVENFEIDVVKKDGNTITISTNAKMYYNSKGEPLGVESIFRDITEQKLAGEKILKYQRRLKDLAQKITITEEVIRKQVAVDLHDHVGQLLASIRIQLSKVNKVEENPEIIDRIENISQALRGAIQATRDAIFNLSPPQLNEIGLYSAVQDWMKEQIEFKHGIVTSISGEDKNLPIDVNTRYLLFRSIRELMHNVVKHAQATKLDVNFCINNGSLEITVRDNGRGFDYNPDQLRLTSDSYGLFSMYERLNDLDGSLVVNSIIDKGSNIKLAVPINGSKI